MTSIHLSVVAFEFLLDQRKYPSATLGIGTHGDEHFKPTIVVIEPGTNRRLSIIEMREDIDSDTLATSAKDCSEFLSRSKLSVPAYLIAPSEKDSYEIQVFKLSGKRNWEMISRESFPTYDELLSTTSTSERLRFKTEGTADELTKLSQKIACFLLFLFVSSTTGLISFNKEQLIILGGVGGFAVLPYFAKIRAFGLEMERDDETEAQIAAGEGKKLKIV